MNNYSFISTSGTYNSVTARSGGLFNPLLVDDFTGASVGDVYPGWNNRSVYASDQPIVSGRSLKITQAANTQSNLNSSLCGTASHIYGGRTTLPISIPIGNTLWVSWKRYIPTNFSYAYCYGGADSAAATACSQNADGNDWLKDLVIGPVTGGRIYAQPFMSRRSPAQQAGNRLICEYGALYNDEVLVEYPLGGWFTHQLCIKVSDSSDGFVREWINETLVNSVSGANVATGNSIAEFGIGDYWNGVPYDNGSVSLTQWVRELIVATDVSGYGAPNGTDSGGRVYIDPITTVAELS